MAVTYKPTSRPCWNAVPSFRGSRVRPDAVELHASCDGIYRGGPLGPYDTGCACHCECHGPEGLPDWKRPQTGQALEDAIALDRQIREDTESIRLAHAAMHGPGWVI